jgi:hypothetical protein
MIGIDEETAPAVTFEACAGYRVSPECPWATCACCGWPEDDHGRRQ